MRRAGVVCVLPVAAIRMIITCEPLKRLRTECRPLSEMQTPVTPGPEGDGTDWNAAYAPGAGVAPQPTANGEYQISFSMKGITYTAPVKKWDTTVAETAAGLSATDQARSQRPAAIPFAHSLRARSRGRDSRAQGTRQRTRVPVASAHQAVAITSPTFTTGGDSEEAIHRGHPPASQGHGAAARRWRQLASDTLSLLWDRQNGKSPGQVSPAGPALPRAAPVLRRRSAAGSAPTSARRASAMTSTSTLSATHTTCGALYRCSLALHRSETVLRVASTQTRGLWYIGGCRSSVILSNHARPTPSAALPSAHPARPPPLRFLSGVASRDC